MPAPSLFASQTCGGGVATRSRSIATWAADNASSARWMWNPCNTKKTHKLTSTVEVTPQANGGLPCVGETGEELHCNTCPGPEKKHGTSMVALACNPSDKQYLVSFYRGCGNDSSAVSLRERNPCWYSCHIPVTWVHSCCSWRRRQDKEMTVVVRVDLVWSHGMLQRFACTPILDPESSEAKASLSGGLQVGWAACLSRSLSKSQFWRRYPWHDIHGMTFKNLGVFFNPDGALGVVVLWPVVVAPWQDSAAWHQTMNDSSGPSDIDFKP